VAVMIIRKKHLSTWEEGGSPHELERRKGSLRHPYRTEGICLSREGGMKLFLFNR